MEKKYISHNFDVSELLHFLQLVEENLFSGDEIGSCVPIIKLQNKNFSFKGDFHDKIFRKIHRPEVSIEFENCVFLGSFFFENVEFSDILFKNCIFSEEDFINGTKNVNALNFSHSYLKSLVITHCVFDAPVAIHASQIDTIEILSSIGHSFDLGSLNNNKTKIKIRKSNGIMKLPIENEVTLDAQSSFSLKENTIFRLYKTH